MAEEYTPDLVTVIDDDGMEHTFEELDRIETDEGRFVALLPTFESEEEAEDAEEELIILEVKEEDGETFLYPIEDDKIWDEVAEIFEDRLADAFEIESVDAEEPEETVLH